MTLHGLVQSLDVKGGGKGDAGRQAMRKGRRGCDQGEATGAMGAMRAGLGVLVLQERHQVGGQEVAGLNLELLSVSSPRQAGRIGLTYPFKTESLLDSTPAP